MVRSAYPIDTSRLEAEKIDRQTKNIRRGSCHEVLQYCHDNLGSQKLNDSFILCDEVKRRVFVGKLGRICTKVV
jgi:hypothetical protein